MRPHCTASLVLGLLALVVCFGPLAGTSRAEDQEVRLIVRGDDMGFCHAANEACIQCYRQGIMRSVEVMVHGPWYPEAVKLLKENPGLDVGVHLTLNAEWEGLKWGPVTKAPSLVDKYGYFSVRIPRAGQSPLEPARPPQAAPSKLEEIEQELEAQIRLAVADIPQVSHLTCHMGTPVATPAMREMVERLAKNYRLPLEAPGVKRAGSMGGARGGPQEKEDAMLRIVEALTPGTYLLVEHPGLDTPEMRAVALPGGESVAAARFGVTTAWTSPKVRTAIAKRNIRLISYAEFHGK